MHFNYGIYFQAPDGLLLEIATDGPGFTRDEDAEALGRKLQLPPWLEGRRREIEAGLTPLDVVDPSTSHSERGAEAPPGSTGASGGEASLEVTGARNVGGSP